MNKIFLFVLSLILIAACSKSNKDDNPAYVHYDINFNEVAPNEVYQAATAGIPGFLHVDSSHVTLGTAFRIYTIQNAALSNCSPPNVAWLLASYDIWYIVATVDSETRYILTIDKMNNEWTLVSSGGTGMADMITEARTLYSQYTPIFIESHEPDGFFFTLPELGDSNLTWFLLYPPRPLDQQSIKSLPEAMAYLNPACASQ